MSAARLMRNPLGKHSPSSDFQSLSSRLSSTTRLLFLQPLYSFLNTQILFWQPRYPLSTAQIPFRRPQIPFRRPRYPLSTAQIPFRRPRSSITTVQPSIPTRHYHPLSARRAVARLTTAYFCAIFHHQTPLLSRVLPLFLFTRAWRCTDFASNEPRCSRYTHVWQKQTLQPDDARRAPRGAIRVYVHQEIAVQRATWTAPASTQANAGI